jgi:hypothetical protein
MIFDALSGYCIGIIRKNLKKADYLNFSVFPVTSGLNIDENTGVPVVDSFFPTFGALSAFSITSRLMK